MKPMEGITVLEFSTMITASFAAMMLGEQGARVIKVEPTDEGDPMRYMGSQKGGISGLFANCNRGKESIRINLREEGGQALIREIIGEVDILINNFRPGVMDKLNLGSEQLRELNPRLIYMAINGFGNAGPMSSFPAYDPVIQAQSGMTATQGTDSPAFIRNLVCDKITAYTACQAVTSALFVREKSGEGQHIDLSMMDAGLFFVFPDGFMEHTLLDEDAEVHPPLRDFLYNPTETADGALTISAANEKQQVGLLMALDLIHLMADDRFNSTEKLLQNLEEFQALVSEAFKSLTSDEAMAKLKENDVPVAKLMTQQEVLSHPQYEANDSIGVQQHPKMGAIRVVKAPAQFGGERLEPGGPAPEHGEHTRSVLESFGVDGNRVEELLAAKLVR